MMRESRFCKRHVVLAKSKVVAEVQLVEAKVQLVEEVQLVQAEVQLVETEVQLVETEVQLVQAEVQLVQAEVQLVEAEVQLVEAEVQLVQAEVQSVEAEVQLVEAEVQLVGRFCKRHAVLDIEPEAHLYISVYRTFTSPHTTIQAAFARDMWMWYWNKSLVALSHSTVHTLTLDCLSCHISLSHSACSLTLSYI